MFKHYTIQNRLYCTIHRYLKNIDIRFKSSSSLLKSFSTFVSKHYNVDQQELRSVITCMKSETRREKDEIVVKVCNLCDKERKTNADNIWKLRVRQDGSYYCFRCSKGGSWFDLKKKTGALSTSSSSSTTKKTIEAFSLNDSNNNNNNNNNSNNNNNYNNHDNKSKSRREDYNTNIDNNHKIIPDQILARSYTNDLFSDFSTDSGTPEVAQKMDSAMKIRKYLYDVRGLRKDILMKYGVGMMTQQYPDDTGKYVDKLCITFPWIMMESELDGSSKSDRSANSPFVITRIKSRALETKGLQRMSPKGGRWGFFGWHLVKPEHSEIIITEGEYDAIAVAQSLADLSASSPYAQYKKIPAISLPNGCNSLPPDLLPLLEHFEKIYLWMDNDKSGIEGCEKFARKLGIKRCYVVRPDATSINPPKDANDALRFEMQGHNNVNSIPYLLSKASLLSHGKILTFSDIKNEALAAIRGTDKESDGTRILSLPRLSGITKGFRRGELVVFTGPTGGGKTTLLSQISLDFCKQGLPTLWGSFEVKNSRLAQKMLQQYLGTGNIKTLPDDAMEKLCDDFEELPLKFLNFHGGSDIDEIIDAMDFSVYVDDVQHIILDNLQFLMPRSTTRRGIEKIDAQDEVIDKFRKFASEKNVNITIVIHPRKEEDGLPLRMSSIFGSAKATQEADMVMLLQKAEGRTWIDVKKNRYDGQLGSVELDFSQIRCSYFEIDSPKSGSTIAKKT